MAQRSLNYQENKYCDQCRGLITFLDTEWVLREHQRSPNRHRLNINSCQECSICALIFEQLSKIELASLLGLGDPHILVTSKTFKSLDQELYFSDPNAKLLSIHVSLLIEDAPGGFQHEIRNNTNCDASWKLARSWLEACNTHHQCRKPTASFLPTRLIQISSLEGHLQARLVESDDLKVDVEYCTLSHCWGSSPMVTLERSNYAFFRQGILVQTLSNTFQDALFATQCLGFQYIWIDSLCIIQHDQGDWKHESMAMRSVYSNSALNLAATAAADGQVGLFFARRPSSVQPCRVYLPARRDKEYYLVRRTLWEDSIEKSPLAQRAWVVQERFLACRTLHFAARQIFWECERRNASETFTSLQRRQFSDIFYGSRLKDNGSEWMLWQSALEHYCCAFLTQETDKLVAFSGIAIHFYSQNNDQYLAGLWRRGIEKQLLWAVFHGEQSALGSQSKHIRPARYRAPSWSWASIDGPIRPCQWLGPESASSSEVLIAVLAANIKPLIPNHYFGQIESASLRIACGQLKKTVLALDSDGCVLLIRTILGLSRFEYLVDVGTLTEKDEVVLLLVDGNHVLYDSNGKERVQLKGVLLQATSLSGQYRRFGTFMIPDASSGYGEVLGVKGVDDFLALPGLEAQDAYEEITGLDAQGPMRYIISLI